MVRIVNISGVMGSAGMAANPRLYGWEDPTNENEEKERRKKRLVFYKERNKRRLAAKKKGGVK